MINGNMTRDITVYLKSGIYRLRRPLKLGPEDSGTGGHTVVWRGMPGASAVISGARRILGWRLSDPPKGIWEAPVPRGVRTRQIYVNGMRATLASGVLPVALHRIWIGYIASSPVLATWRNPSSIDFVYSSQLGDNVEPRCPIGSIQGDLITMAQPCWSNSNIRQENLVGFSILTYPTYVENAYELLDRPGQFYLDGSAHKLYYIPRKGEDMRTADVEVPALQTLVAGRGWASAPIHNITFANLQFSYATWLQPGTPTGFSEIQSGYTITGAHGYATQGLCKLVPHGTCPYGVWTKEPGNVQFAFDRSLTFVDDRFVHLGAAGLNLDDGSQSATVAGSVFTDISGNGIEIGSVDRPRAKPPSQTRNVRVFDNHLYGLPVEYHGGAAILVGYAADSTISHNQIDHTPYIPISMGWGGWPDKVMQPSVPNFSHDNVVSDNLIYDFMQVLSDGGGVYTQGITGRSMRDGEKVIGNVIHDQLDWGAGVKSDDGATFITYADNVLYNNFYDWAGVHYDYRGNAGGTGTPNPCHLPTILRNVSGSPGCWFDPELIEDNWWQQGEPGFSLTGLTERGNTIITGPQQAPNAIVANAGIEPAFRSILKWRPSGESAPNAPERVSTLYAFDGRAYVTWHPSYAQGNAPVISYSINVCAVSASSIGGDCRRPALPPVTVPAGKLDRLGYAVVWGLKDGRSYTVTVTADSSNGAGTPSIPSPVITPSSQRPNFPDRPRHLGIWLGHDVVTLTWYRPANVPDVRGLSLRKGHGSRGPSRSGNGPALVLRYIVTSSTGRRYDVTSHMELISTNEGGRVLTVIGGLIAGHRYRFSIAAVTPAGIGPAALTPWFTPA